MVEGSGSYLRVGFAAVGTVGARTGALFFAGFAISVVDVSIAASDSPQRVHCKSERPPKVRASHRTPPLALHPHARTMSTLADFVNLTPHDINYVDATGQTYTLRSTTSTRAVSEPTHRLDPVHHAGLNCIAEPRFIGIENFPFSEERPDEWRNVIVAGLAAPHVPQWFTKGVYGPDTGPDAVVRDDAGRIIGTRQFICYRPAVRDTTA